jgi:Histidine kinase
METSLVARFERHLGLASAELPRGMAWLYAAGAVLAVPVFSRNVFQLATHLQVQALVGNALPFLAGPAVIHAAYRFVMPRLLAARATAAGRVLTHVMVSALTASVVATVMWAFVSSLGWKRAPLSGFVTSQIVTTWAILFPAKLVLAWRERARASEQLRREAERVAARNELYAIQSRAHPHFLFNAINTVAALIPEDPRRAEETLERLADVLRYILETSTATATPLAKDLAILREYLEIQRVRFEHLHYSIEVAAGLDDVLMPPLALLPLVENAVLHGVADAGSGNVTVRIVRDGDALTFHVDDDGPGPGRSTRHGTGTALRDLGRRLELLYGGEASLVTAARGAGGHAVTLRLPQSGALAA